MQWLVSHASEYPQTSLELLRAKIRRAAGRDAEGRAGAPWGQDRAARPSGGRARATGLLECRILGLRIRRHHGLHADGGLRHSFVRTKAGRRAGHRRGAISVLSVTGLMCEPLRRVRVVLRAGESGNGADQLLQAKTRRAAGTGAGGAGRGAARPRNGCSTERRPRARSRAASIYHSWSARTPTPWAARRRQNGRLTRAQGGGQACAV